jgi:tryptophan-rich sensory protein
MKKLITFIACILLTLSVGGLSGYLTSTQIPGWYAGLQKPSFNPPNYLFGPVWTLLYLLMGISLFIVIRSGISGKSKPIIIFATQLVLNFFWSIIFFNFHQVSLALVDILLLWLCIFIMIRSFYKINKAAGLMQIPYLLWVSFATALNTAILILN